MQLILPNDKTRVNITCRYIYILVITQIIRLRIIYYSPADINVIIVI